MIYDDDTLTEADIDAMIGLEELEDSLEVSLDLPEDDKETYEYYTEDSNVGYQ